MVYVIDALGRERDARGTGQDWRPPAGKPPAPSVPVKHVPQSGLLGPAGGPPPFSEGAGLGFGTSAPKPGPVGSPGPSWVPPTRPAGRPAIRGPIRPSQRPGRIAEQRDLGFVGMLGRLLFRASPLAIGGNALLRPSPLGDGTLTDAQFIAQQLGPGPDVFPNAIAEISAPSPGSWTVLLVPAGETFIPRQARVPSGLVIPTPDWLPSVDPTAPLPRVISEPWKEGQTLGPKRWLPRSDDSPFVETRIVIEAPPPKGGPRARPEPVTVRALRPRVPRAPNSKRNEEGKMGRRLYNVGLMLINSTYGAVTEIADLIEVLAHSVYALDRQGNAVPAMSLNGLSMHETFIGLVEGRYRLDVVGFAVDYAINQTSDIFWSLTDAPFDALHRRAPNWATYGTVKRTQREAKDAYSDHLKALHDWAEGNLRSIDAGRASRIENLFSR